eukprot:6185857-Pleurochrysis_carterae.AAC.2
MHQEGDYTQRARASGSSPRGSRQTTGAPHFIFLSSGPTAAGARTSTSTSRSPYRSTAALWSPSSRT